MFSITDGTHHHSEERVYALSVFGLISMNSTQEAYGAARVSRSTWPLR